jgi:two-component system, sensor histidine kinase and response regulator
MNKILVVEDEELVRLSLTDILEAEDFKVIAAENGMIGVGLARKEQPDLIICDIMMPGMDGYGVLSALQQDPITTTIPFIFLTAKTDKSAVRQGMQLGADDYLTKPFSRDDLLRAINTRLSKNNTFNQQIYQKISELRQHLVHPLPEEFVAPLSAIRLAADMLRQVDLEEQERHEIARGLDQASDRVQRLIHNFLLYADLEAIAAHPESMRALRQIWSSNTKELIETTARQKAQEVGREADLILELQDASVPMADENVRKMAEELIDNAFRYSAPGTSVRVASVVSGQRFLFYVMDNGRGLDTGMMTALSGLSRMQSKLQTKSGPGLGLAITKRLVELHGGEVYFESIKGRKTIARVFLPCVTQG